MLNKPDLIWFNLIVRLLFCIIIFSAQLTLAQTVFIEDRQAPVDVHPIHQQLRVRFLPETFAPFVLEENLPQRLQSSLQSLQNIPPQKCSDESSYQFTLSLAAKGDFAACANYVKNCLQEERNTPVSTIIQGARCAKTEYQFQDAHSIFTQGMNSTDFKGERASALILEFALFTQNTIYPEQTTGIINLHPFWNAEEKEFMQALVDLLVKNGSSVKTKEQILGFVNSQIAVSDDFYNRLLKIYRITIYQTEYQFQTAYNYLQQDVASFINPLDWWQPGFHTSYRLAENADFNKVIALYRAFVPFAHPRSFLPMEQNVYNYTQIYNSVCQTNMLQGAERAAVKNDLTLWKNSQISLGEVIRRIEARNIETTTKSDLLSTYAGLLVINNQINKAREFYWKSHVACPFNNRSHWGLVLLERKRKYSAYPEYAANILKMRLALQDIEFPPEIETYVMNWKSFPPTSQERIKYGARIWAPFIKQLIAANYKVYIKLPFELLSEAPGYAGIRDQRIGPPNMPTYKLDNRLWDDVRGAGGRNVISDHDETFETIHGDYNLLGHEVAHQFHAYLDSRYPALSSCIERLYNAAKARNVFPDPYASTNSREYFAQGITYFLIPADAPARYGINVSWYPVNDVDLYNFMLSIQGSGGDFGRIVCPRAE